MTSLSNGSSGSSNGTSTSSSPGLSLNDLPKSCNFTSKLPPDPQYPTPRSSHQASSEELGPRLVKGALYTFVRPGPQKEHELLAVSPAAFKDLGLRQGEENTSEFQESVSGNRILGWDKETGEGVYPWAQCYGGWQFGSWAGQLGDGRAISLFEITNTSPHPRYELQLKGAGRTPYSRFADGKAVLRSSIREFVVSEALNALHIPSTRALALTLLPSSPVRRERVEPGAIVARFSPSWLRIGTFDLLCSRGDRGLIRQLASYVATDVFSGWESLPARFESPAPTTIPSATNIPADKIQGPKGEEENRFTRLYREIVHRNARTVAAWQAYGFMNGVLNTDNTSIMGLSLDFGPFAFMDDFDPNYTPNHDDGALRYSYKNQPTIIWWNLVRLGETLGELMGAGADVDQKDFVENGVKEEAVDDLVKQGQAIIERTGEEYKVLFLGEYKRIMTKRLGLKTEKVEDFKALFSELLDTLEALELDFNHFFRRLCTVRAADLETPEQRREIAGIFFHHQGPTGTTSDDTSARDRLGVWLKRWSLRMNADWGSEAVDSEERVEAMKTVNPKFVPRSWVLDELIKRVEHGNEREILKRVLNMALHPFEDTWGGDAAEEERFCGDVPRTRRGMQCSCSS